MLCPGDAAAARGGRAAIGPRAVNPSAEPEPEPVVEGAPAPEPAAEPELEPAIAESWEITDENTTFTATLREGVSFHDGSPVDADSFATAAAAS